MTSSWTVRAAVWCAACAAAALAGQGCAADPRQGYSWDSTFRGDVSSVSVPVFTNTTFQHGLEVKLGQALVSEIQRTTPYKVVGSGGTAGAQTTLEGTITAASLVPLSIARETGLVQELALNVTVDFSWKDNRSGKVLTARRNFSSSKSFVPSRGVGERLEVGENAAVAQLARDIVAEMRSGW